MPAQPETSSTPKRLMLSTDLSARCDRALDRSTQLASEWQAELVALNVLEAAQAPDQILTWSDGAGLKELEFIAQQKLQEDLTGFTGAVSLRIAQGDAAQQVKDIAANTGSELVVTGMARDEPLGRFVLGSTVERLARSLPQPLLVVRNRPRGSYLRIVVASDFSDSSREALQTAARLFPLRELVIYHALSQPMPGVSTQDSAELQAKRIEEGVCAEFIASCNLPEQARQRLRVVIEPGPLERSLARYVRNRGVDLAIIGAQGKGALLDMLLGSSATRLLDWLSCDTLIVRKAAAAR